MWGITQGQFDFACRVRSLEIPKVVLANQGVVDGIREDYPAAMNNTVYDYLASQQVCVRHPICFRMRSPTFCPMNAFQR